jgi:hypothetical protein
MLPNAERTLIDDAKLVDYSLAADHPVGANKALLFRSLLGLTVGDADTLRRLILEAVLVYDAVAGRRDEFGQRYAVDFPVKTEVGSAVVRSTWILRQDENFPRLTSCSVLPK